ncbi:MAG: hypothetical protein ACXWUG_18585 [Polyangiales bacterium]
MRWLAVAVIVGCSKPHGVGPDPTPSVSVSSPPPPVSSVRGACIWTFKEPIRGLSATCRDDGTSASCIKYDSDERAVFTPGRTCPALGFGCLGNGMYAAYRRTNPDGTCPPGSSLP